MDEETLLAALPEGYKRDFEQKTNESLISEMVPVGQSVSNWKMDDGSGVLRAQDNAGAVQSPDGKGAGGRMSGSGTQPVAQGNENGYPSLVWLEDCPLNKATGKPEITWFKAIAGNDSFYVVQVAFKAWPSKELITQWMHYLRDVRVCDTRLPERACAPAAAAARATGCVRRRRAVARRVRCGRGRSRRRGTGRQAHRARGLEFSSSATPSSATTTARPWWNTTPLTARPNR